MTVIFELDGQEFTALNGGPHFTFTEAISLVVNCETQNRSRKAKRVMEAMLQMKKIDIAGLEQAAGAK